MTEKNIIVEKTQTWEKTNDELYLMKPTKKLTSIGNIVLYEIIHHKNENGIYVPYGTDEFVVGFLSEETENKYKVVPIETEQMKYVKNKLAGNGSWKKIYFLDPTAKNIINKIPVGSLEKFDPSLYNLYETEARNGNTERNVNIININEGIKEGDGKNILTVLDLYFAPDKNGKDVCIDGGILGNVVAYGFENNDKRTYLIEPIQDGGEKQKAIETFMQEIVNPEYERLKGNPDISSVVPDIKDFEPYFW